MSKAKVFKLLTNLKKKVLTKNIKSLISKYYCEDHNN